MAKSQPRQNFHEDCEKAINDQINLELHTSYVYQCMAFNYDRDDIALKGFYEFFKQRSEEKRENAERFMKYQNKRGGRILLKDIKKGDCEEWQTGLLGMQTALSLEKNSNQCLLDLHKLAESKRDAQFADFLEDEYLRNEVERIKTVCDHVTNLQRVGAGLGEYMFDKKTLGGESG